MEQYSECTSPSGTILIRDMAQDDRPREKAIKNGIKSLSNTELMAILFGTGIKGKSVLRLCEEILADNDNHISNVARLSIADFTRRYKGVGQAKAICILAALELGARSAEDFFMRDNPVINSSQKAVDAMRRNMAGLPHEEFWIMLLSQAGKIIRNVCVSRGGVSMTAVDIKIVLKSAIENLASAMILFHNHPSGSLTPSAQDDNLTRRICEGARAIDIRVNDHIIINDGGGFYSYHDNGRLPV